MRPTVATAGYPWWADCVSLALRFFVFGRCVGHYFLLAYLRYAFYEMRVTVGTGGARIALTPAYVLLPPSGYKLMGGTVVRHR